MNGHVTSLLSRLTGAGAAPRDRRGVLAAHPLVSALGAGLLGVAALSSVAMPATGADPATPVRVAISESRAVLGPVEGSWTVTGAAGGAHPVDLDTYRAVPGDVLRFVGTADLEVPSDTSARMTTDAAAFAQQLDAGPVQATARVEVGGREVTDAGIVVKGSDRAVGVQLTVAFPAGGEAMPEELELPAVTVRLGAQLPRT